MKQNLMPQIKKLKICAKSLLKMNSTSSMWFEEHTKNKRGSHGPQHFAYSRSNLALVSEDLVDTRMMNEKK